MAETALKRDETESRLIGLRKVAESLEAKLSSELTEYSIVKKEKEALLEATMQPNTKERASLQENLTRNTAVIEEVRKDSF